MFVIAHLSIFVIAAFSSCHNTKIYVAESLVSIIFPKMSWWLFDCQVILVYILDIFEYYVMTLWVLFISYEKGWQTEYTW